MSFVYIDTSVALAQLLSEDRCPAADLWTQSLLSSRLLEYEVWTRIHARKLGKTHSDSVRSLIGRIALIELISPVLTRAIEPFPAPVRTLDALHLASLIFVTENGQEVELATYDENMTRAAKALEIKLYNI